MNTKDEKLINTMIESFGNIGESLGVNRTLGQIYALLYFSDTPLAPTQISETLGISKGNVSINIRKLEEWNALKKVWRKGRARSLYKANENIEEIFFDRIKSISEKRIKYLKQVMAGIRHSPDENFTKIKQIKDFVKKLDFLLKNFDSIKSFLK